MIENKSPCFDCAHKRLETCNKSFSKKCTFFVDKQQVLDDIKKLIEKTTKDERGKDKELKEAEIKQVFKWRQVIQKLQGD